MNWVFFAILAPALWSITNLFDKYLLEKHVPNVYVYLFFTGVLNLLVLLGIPFLGFAIPPIPILIIALIAGALFNYQILPYLKALTIEEASRVVPLYQLSPVFVLILSFLFLHEHLTSHELLAFPLLVLGGFLVSLKRVEGVFHISKAFFFMLLAAFLFSLHVLTSKYVYLNMNFYQGFTWISIGGFISALPLLLSKQTRKDTALFFRKSSMVKGAMVVNELVNLGAVISLQLALAAGPSPLVIALGGTQPFFVLLFTLLTSLTLPQLIKEETKMHIVFHKAIALAIIFIGVCFASI